MALARTHSLPKGQTRSGSPPWLAPQGPGSEASSPARAPTVPRGPGPSISLQKAVRGLHFRTHPGGTLTSQSASEDPGEEGTPACGDVPATQRALPTAPTASSMSSAMPRTAQRTASNQPFIPFPAPSPPPLHSHTTQKMGGVTSTHAEVSPPHPKRTCLRPSAAGAQPPQRTQAFRRSCPLPTVTYQPRQPLPRAAPHIRQPLTTWASSI